MPRRYLIFAMVSLLGVIFATLPIFQYPNAAGLPFQVERTATGELAVVALPGIPLPAGLEAGDVIDWTALSSGMRMVVNTTMSGQRLAAGGRFVLKIRRDRSPLSVSVTSVLLTSASGRLSALVYTIIQNFLLLALLLFTLWRGRDWVAWGLSLYAFMWMAGGTNGTLIASPVMDLAMLVTSDLLIYPLGLIGLYVSADHLAGPFLNRRCACRSRLFLPLCLDFLKCFHSLAALAPYSSAGKSPNGSGR